MTSTKISVTQKQHCQTVAGNFYLGVLFHIGLHRSQYGTRSIYYYSSLVDMIASKCCENSDIFRGLPERFGWGSVSSSMDAILAIGESVAEIKHRMSEDLDGLLFQAVTFWENAKELGSQRKQLERLAESQIIDMTIDSSDNEYAARVNPESLRINKARFSMSSVELYFKESGTKLLYETLIKQSDIKSVINVGCRIDSTLYFCANEFPERTFLGVDFQHNLRHQNRIAFGSLPSNLHFASGYALEMFEEGLSADAVFFMATSVLFSVNELRSYLAALAKNKTKTVIISESWASPVEGYNYGKLICPEEVDVNTPYFGGTVLNLHHNYIALLEEAGYNVEISELIDDSYGSWYNIIQIVANLNECR